MSVSGVSVSGGGVTQRLYGDDLSALWGRLDAIRFLACRTRRSARPAPCPGQALQQSHLLLFSVLAVLTGATSYKGSTQH